MTVGLTQSEGRLVELEPLLLKAGHVVVRQPLIETKTIWDVDLETLYACPWWLITSVAAVQALCELGVTLSGRKLGAVGEATARAIRESGGTVYLTSAEASATGLLEAFLALGEAGPVGLPRGNRALPILCKGLIEKGFEVWPVVIYQTDAIPWPEASAIPEITLVASPSAIEGLTDGFARKTRFVALGSTTAQAVQARGWKCVVPRSANAKDALEAIQTLAKSTAKVGGKNAHQEED